MIQPTKVRLRACAIKGVDMRMHCKSLAVYESMCKPYITSKFIIVDRTNMINGMQLMGGDPINFAFDGGGEVYESEQFILTINGEASTQNGRTIIYTITAATEAYFKDRANLVQQSFLQQQHTSAAQQIHSQFIGGNLFVAMPSMGMIAKKDIGSYISSNVKPFKAIEDILRRATYGAYKSGSTVYFQDKEGHVIAPLEHLFATLAPQQVFEQRATWGSDWRHIFTATNAIIAAQTIIDENKNSGRAGSQQLAAASSQALNVYDMKDKGLIVSKAAQAFSSGPMSRFAAKNGGIVNTLMMDSARNDPSQDPAQNRIQENLFQAKIKDGVNYLIKVPIQSGIQVTIGQGIDARLIPPSGDQNTGYNAIGGLMLVADLCHECFFDDRQVQATTTMRAVQINYNV